MQLDDKPLGFKNHLFPQKSRTKSQTPVPNSFLTKPNIIHYEIKFYSITIA